MSKDNSKKPEPPKPPKPTPVSIPVPNKPAPAPQISVPINKTTPPPAPVMTIQGFPTPLVKQQPQPVMVSADNKKQPIQRIEKQDDNKKKLHIALYTVLAGAVFLYLVARK